MRPTCLICVVLVGLAAAAGAASSGVRGVGPNDVERYSGSTFSCGGRVIPADHVNDDYCDCEEDGSDEPGTSACASGRFYCQNRLHRPSVIPSSRVNDGVQDCCDGSDEWDGRVAVRQTCREMGAEAHRRDVQRFEEVKKGLEARREAARRAEEELGKREGEVQAARERLEAEKKEVARLEEVKKTVQEAEDKKSKEIAEKKEQEKPKEDEKPKEEEKPQEAGEEEKAMPTVEPMPTIQEAKRQVGWEHGRMHHANVEGAKPEEGEKEEEEKPKEENGPAKAAEEEPREEQGPAKDEAAAPPPQPAEDPELAAAKEEHDNEEAPVDDAPEHGHAPEPIVEPTPEKEPAREQEKDHHGDEEEEDWDDGEDRGFLGNVAAAGRFVWHKTKKLFRKKPVHVEHHRNEATSKADNDLEAARSKERKARDDLEALEKELKTDWGEDKCFHSMRGKCYEMKKDEYTYELCAFDKATQKGDSHTSLGTWSRWSPDHKVMEFTGGVGCWNGPQRSVNVTLECGEDVKLLEATEPARCEYAMRLSTPCSCTPEMKSALESSIAQYELDLAQKH